MGTNKELTKDNTRERNAKANYNIRHSLEIEEYNRIFTERLKNAREAKKLTQKEAAKKLDVHLPTYRKYEQISGNRSDIAYFMRSLTDTFDVSADYLIGKSPTPHPEYDDIIKTTGLNAKAICQLQTLYAMDDVERYQGYLDFINCFLGNEDCTSVFFEGLQPILRRLNDAMNGTIPSPYMEQVISIELTNYLFNYLVKVVIPTYCQLYNTGDYASVSLENYLFDNAIPDKK
mgnify:CR=1 FL=1